MPKTIYRGNIVNLILIKLNMQKQRNHCIILSNMSFLSQPPTRTFNSTAGGVSKGTCNLNSCAISVVLPRNYNTKLSFTCEVSTEGPRFAVVKQTKNLTVAGKFSCPFYKLKRTMWWFCAPSSYVQ